MSDTSSFSDTLNQIGEKLSAAIHAGDVNEATILVAQLSNMQLKFDINVKRQESEQRNIDHEFSVRVHVEDRLSDGCYFNLQVRSTDTIQDLKRKVMLKYNFPEEVQRWIIGKKIPEKDVKLSQCGVKGPGHTLYLYLVTARSVGLSKQDYEARRNSLKHAASVPHKQQTQSSGHSPVQKDPPEPFWPAPPSPSETQYNSYSNNSPLLASSPVLGIGEFDQTQNSYGTVRQTSKKSLTSGSSLIQEMLLGSSSANNGTDAESHPIPATSEGASVAPALWDFVYGRSQGRVSPPQEHFPISSPSSEKIGWPCPMCTYINLPVRPGCEICAAPRPQEYQIPPDYQMTAEECSLLENQQILERMTREARPTARPDVNQQASIPGSQFNEDQQFTEALNAFNINNSNANRRHSSGNNQVIGNDYVLVPEGSDWTNIEEMTLRVSPRHVRHHHRHSRSSHRNVHVAAPPPSQGSQQHSPRNSQMQSRSPHSIRLGSHLQSDPAHPEFSHQDVTED